MWIIILLVGLFGITLVFVCGSAFGDLLTEYFRGGPIAVIERKARSSVKAADMGWAAIVSAPLVGILLGSIVIPVELWWKGVRDADPLGYGQKVLLVILVSSIAGVIVAGAYWTSSAILGKARDWDKKTLRSGDPDLDAPM
jgi:hypothetical protein